MSKKSKARKAEAAARASASSHSEAVDSFNRKASQRETAKQPRIRIRRKLPNWPLFGLAVLGVALTGYLSYTALAGEKLAYCGVGSGCDTVQSSRWATLLGIPIATWGLGAYLVLTWISWRVKDTAMHWQLAWLVAVPSLAVSLYLTAISIAAIQATCFYCLTSLGLIEAIVALLMWQSRAVPGITWPAWLAQTGGLAVVIVVALFLHFSGVFSKSAGPEDPYLKGLAEHLKASGAVFYGASWCPHCQEQKAMFGASAARLPYVECSPNGPQAPQAGVCVAQGVHSYPTWTFGQAEHSGTISIEELAQRTGYPPPPK
jgi:uncharacterized membrane protein